MCHLLKNADKHFNEACIPQTFFSTSSWSTEKSVDYFKTKRTGLKKARLDAEGVFRHQQKNSRGRVSSGNGDRAGQKSAHHRRDWSNLASCLLFVRSSGRTVAPRSGKCHCKMTLKSYGSVICWWTFVIKWWRKSKRFLQSSWESTAVASCSQLLVFAWYPNEDAIEEECWGCYGLRFSIVREGGPLMESALWCLHWWRPSNVWVTFGFSCKSQEENPNVVGTLHDSSWSTGFKDASPKLALGAQNCHQDRQLHQRQGPEYTTV